MQVKRHSSVSSQLPADQDETYIYATSNEYIEEQFYETVADSSVRVRMYLYGYIVTYIINVHLHMYTNILTR